MGSEEAAVDSTMLFVERPGNSAVEGSGNYEVRSRGCTVRCCVGPGDAVCCVGRDTVSCCVGTELTAFDNAHPCVLVHYSCFLSRARWDRAVPSFQDPWC